MDQDDIQYEKGRFRIFAIVRKTWFGDDRKAGIPSNRSYGPLSRVDDSGFEYDAQGAHCQFCPWQVACTYAEPCH